MQNPIEIQSSSDYIVVNISNSQNDSIAFEKKFPKNLAVAQLKSKLEIITGANANSMQLQLYDGDRLIAKIEDDAAMLGSLPIEANMRLHVIDNFAWMSEENVEKFVLSDEQYDTKSDSLRSFLKKNRLGKYNEDEMRELDEKKKLLAEEELRKADICKIGARCKVTVKGNPTRYGTIMYNGAIDGKKGIFIGVKYDEPLGKNDGSIDGKRYFTCQNRYGGFVPPGSVEVGNFPPEDGDLDDEL